MLSGCSCGAKGCDSKLFALELALSALGVAAGDRQAGLDPQHLVFIDETCIETSMAPLQGSGIAMDLRRLLRWRARRILCQGQWAPAYRGGAVDGKALRGDLRARWPPHRCARSTSLRWMPHGFGCRPNARRMRCTEETEIPDALAMPRELQCVAFSGRLSNVFTMTALIRSSSIERGALVAPFADRVLGNR